MKPYTPLHVGSASPLACERCQRVFTSMTQLSIVDYGDMVSASATHYVCRHTAACAKRRERLAGIHVKAWRDLCEFLDGQPFKAATPFTIPAALHPVIDADTMYERIILDNQYLLPVKYFPSGEWQLVEDWAKRLQRIEQGELRRFPGDLEAMR